VLVTRLSRTALALCAALLAARPAAAAAVAESPAAWQGYAQSLALPGNGVASSLGLDVRSPLVVASLASVMALQPSLSPAAMAARPPLEQASAIREAIRAAAAPALDAEPARAAAMKPEALVRLGALAEALPAGERRALVARVDAEFSRRGDSLAAAARREADAFEERAAQTLPAAEEVPAGGVSAGEGARSGLKRYEPAARPRAEPAIEAAPARDRQLRTFPDLGSAAAWLRGAPMGLLDQVEMLPTGRNEAGDTLSPSAAEAMLDRAISGWGDSPPQEVMISRRRGTRRVLGFDVPIRVYDVLISEVPADAPMSAPGTVGLHRTSLSSALEVIRSGYLLAVPGRMTFTESSGDAADSKRAGGEPALRIGLREGGYLRSVYFRQTAYAPSFVADPVPPDAASRAARTRAGSPIPSFARAGMLRRIPFTAADARATLELLEAQRRAGMRDEEYRPMKDALEAVLR